MSDFFHGWRRKLGCVLLVMATVVVGIWIRSSIVYDQCVWADSNHKNVVYSLNGEFGWLRWSVNRRQQLSFGSVPLDSDGEAKWRMLHDMMRAMNDAGKWTGSYWFIATPLTLLSAYLILWKPRKIFESGRAMKLAASACVMAACGFTAIGIAFVDSFSVYAACWLLVVAFAMGIAAVLFRSRDIWI